MRHSRAIRRNPGIVDWTARYQGRGNLEFFADALRALARQGVGNGGVGVVGLLGQMDLPGVTLRMAQSVLRWDLRPSLWSHAFLIAGPPRPRLAETPIWEVTLHARDGDFPAPELNGVLEGTLGDYADHALDANVALLAVRMSDEQAREVIERARRPNIDRVRYDFWEMLGAWQAYLWAHGDRPNPLEAGMAMPASAYVEMAFEAINLDLVPGASERHSAPEHLWNGAVWWHEAYGELEHPVAGYHVLRNRQAYLRDAAPPELTDHLSGWPDAKPRTPTRRRAGR